jgi:hypothetical protein
MTLVRPRPARPALPRPLTLLALGVLMLVGLGRPALAQPGDGIVKPISAREINEFAERLGLTPMQRAAIDPIHDAYKADFDELRQQLIEPFMARQREMNSGGPNVTREAVESMLDDQRRIATRVAALDGRFFDQMTPLLSNDQVAVLPRVRLARERSRAQVNGMMMAFGGTPADLSAIVSRARLRLTGEQALRVDEILEPYERRLTRRLVDLDEKASGMMLKLVDAMDQAGFLGMSQEDMMSDPARMQEVMQVMQRAFMDASGEAREVSTEILELNLDTYRRLMRTMPAPAAIRFRELFLSEGVQVGVRPGSMGPSAVWSEALRTRELDDATRTRLMGGLEAALAGETQIIDPVIDASADARANIDPMNMDMSVFEEVQNLTANAGSTLRTRAETAETEVAAILGDDWRTRVAAIGEGEDAAAGMPGGVPAGMAGAMAIGTSNEGRAVGDTFVPGRISVRAMNAMADRIGIAADDRPILEALHTDYRDAYVALPEIDRIKSVWRDRWNDSAESTAVERARALNTARRRAMDAIASLDERLFADLQTTFGADAGRAAAIERERMARHAERLLGAGEGRSVTARGGGRAGDVDLLEIVRTVELGDADRTAATMAMAERMEAVIGVADRLFTARLALEIAQAEWQSEIEAMDQGDPMAFQDVYTKTMGGPSERLEAIRRELADINTMNLERVESALSSEGRRAVQEAWRIAAYPSIYRDPMCVLGHYERALALDDLEPGQRDELGAALATYRGEWERLSADLVARIASVSVDFSDWQNVDWADVQRIEQELQTIGFDRSEQNIRAANRLRLVLREDQLARIGGLPNADEEVTPSIWMFN